MGIKNFNVNGKNYLIDDILLNTVVEELKRTKMDAFEPKLPLYIDGNKLSINLNDYATMVYTNSTRDALKTTINDNENKTTSKFSHIYDALKHILGEYITVNSDSMIDISADAPKLGGYNDNLDGMSKRFDKTDNTIQANKEDIENKLLDESITINGRISDHEDSNDKRFVDVENRCKTLEDEVYGTVKTVPEGSDSYTSRIDTLEEKVDLIYGSLKALGLLSNIIDPPTMNRFDEINNAIDEIKKQIEELKK